MVLSKESINISCWYNSYTRQWVTRGSYLWQSGGPRLYHLVTLYIVVVLICVIILIMFPQQWYHLVVHFSKHAHVDKQYMNSWFCYLDFLRQGIMFFRLTLNSLSLELWTSSSSCFQFPSARTVGIQHHCPPDTWLFNLILCLHQQTSGAVCSEEALCSHFCFQSDGTQSSPD